MGVEFTDANPVTRATFTDETESWDVSFADSQPVFNVSFSECSGMFTLADKIKLDGIESGAEVNRRDYLFFAAGSQANGVSTAIATGIVYEAIFRDKDAGDAESTIYRFVSTAKNARGFPEEDSYYSGFDGTNLTGKLAQIF